MSQDTIRIEEFLPFEPAKVWRALTDAALVGRWLMPTDFVPTLGHRFSFDTGGWGKTECEVVALESEALLAYTWRNPPLDTVITWRLLPRAEGTLLTMEHSGFNLEDESQTVAFGAMSDGWRSEIMTRLRQCLDEMAAAAGA